MEQQRKKDAEYLNEQQIRRVVDIFDVLVENSRAVQSCGIRIQMYEVEKPERHDAGQLVEFSQQEGFAEFDRHRRTDRTLVNRDQNRRATRSV